MIANEQNVEWTILFYWGAAIYKIHISHIFGYNLYSRSVFKYSDWSVGYLWSLEAGNVFLWDCWIIREIVGAPPFWSSAYSSLERDLYFTEFVCVLLVSIVLCTVEATFDI